MPSPRMPRRLDHLVLPVASLESTRARHEALGFTVAPDARHPFGTENACVFFADGSYLEPLAIAQREECEAAARAGNVFIARDQAFRFRRGEEGLSALVVTSADAAADHARFVTQGMSGGQTLEFSRPMKLEDGSEVVPSFRLAFSADLRSPDFFGFAVQRIDMPPMRSGAMTRHPNGVIGIAEVVLSEPNPTDFQYYLQELAENREVESHSFGMEVALDGATINVMTPEGIRGWFGRRVSGHSRGLRGQAVVFTVEDLKALAGRLSDNGVATREQAGRLIVDEAPGQGVLYAFEEKK